MKIAVLIWVAIILVIVVGYQLAQKYSKTGSTDNAANKAVTETPREIAVQPE